MEHCVFLSKRTLAGKTPPSDNPAHPNQRVESVLWIEATELRLQQLCKCTTHDNKLGQQEHCWLPNSCSVDPWLPWSLHWHRSQWEGWRWKVVQDKEASHRWMDKSGDKPSQAWVQVHLFSGHQGWEIVVRGEHQPEAVFQRPCLCFQRCCPRRIHQKTQDRKYDTRWKNSCLFFVHPQEYLWHIWHLPTTYIHHTLLVWWHTQIIGGGREEQASSAKLIKANPGKHSFFFAIFKYIFSKNCVFGAGILLDIQVCWVVAATKPKAALPVPR